MSRGEDFFRVSAELPAPPGANSRRQSSSRRRSGLSADVSRASEGATSSVHTASLRTSPAAPHERDLLTDVVPSTALLTAAPAPAAAGLLSLKQLTQHQQQHAHPNGMDRLRMHYAPSLSPAFLPRLLQLIGGTTPLPYHRNAVCRVPCAVCFELLIGGCMEPF